MNKKIILTMYGKFIIILAVEYKCVFTTKFINVTFSKMYSHACFTSPTWDLLCGTSGILSIFPEIS